MDDTDRRDNPVHGSSDGDSSSDPAWLEASILASASDDARAVPAEPGPDEAGIERAVLVVASDPDLRTYVRQCLAHMASIRVVEAADPYAVGTGSSMPDLVVVDVDGDRTRAPMDRLMVRRPELRTVPLIVITDEVRVEGGGSADAQPAPDAVLVKPFNARRLCAEVRRVLATGPPEEA